MGGSCSRDELQRCFSCACPRNGLAQLRLCPLSLAASHIQRAGSVGRGEIFFWTGNKHMQAERRYPLEPIVPLACTNNGVYIAGGGMSGKVYLWEVSSWSLLASWTAHHKGVTCLVFSDDDSLLISGADDGTVLVWPLIRIMNKSEGTQATPPFMSKLFLYRWSGHRAPVTAIISSTGGSNAVVVTSSLDQTCKVWGLGTGKLLQSFTLQSAIISIILHPNGQLYAGTASGKIFICFLDLWYPPAFSVVAKSHFTEIVGHSSSVTALASSEDGVSFVSGSEDKFVRIWDVRTGGIVKEHPIKGPVTNLLTVPEGYAFGHCKEQEASVPKGRALHVPLVGECSVLGDPVVCLCASASRNGEIYEGHLYSTSCLDKQLLELKNESTPAALEMKISIVKEKKAEAFKTNEEFSKQTELLRALYTEIRHSLSEKEGP